MGEEPGIISACGLLPSQSRDSPSMGAVVGFFYICPSCIPDPTHNTPHPCLWVFTGHRRRPHLSWKPKQRHKNLCLARVDSRRIVSIGVKGVRAGRGVLPQMRWKNWPGMVRVGVREEPA